MLFSVDDESDSMVEIKKSTFSELHYKERKHLQEWIAKNPSCLCTKETDKLLIIQKEFDGFDGTRERLDLLALDQSGALVVIENKCDDTGRDVTWQALKYVSYCSTLKKHQIVGIYQQYLDKYAQGEDAEENLVDFFEGNTLEEVSLNAEDQRMILVAAEFRPEVTSTAMWMLAHSLRVQCFKANPYRLSDGSVLLDVEQIIPVKEAEDYVIKMAEKDREKDEEQASAKGIQVTRQKFWRELLTRYNTLDTSFANVNPSKDRWLSCGSGVSCCTFSFLAATTYAGVELNISFPERTENKRVFDALESRRDGIEEAFAGQLSWERQDDNKRSRVAVEMKGVDVSNEGDWETMKQFLCDVMPRFIRALKQPLRKAVHG